LLDEVNEDEANQDLDSKPAELSSSNKKRTKKRKRSADKKSQEAEQDEESDEGTNAEDLVPITNHETEANSSNAMSPENVPSIPRTRPNAMHRFLLGQGRIGHILTMESILAVDWVRTYLPTLASLFVWFTSLVLPNRTRLELDDEYAATSQTTGFVTTDGSAVRGGKKRKAQTQKADQRALDQLKRIGDVRHQYLSEAFMKRHGIGPYACATSSSPDGIEVADTFHKSAELHEADESDTEWVVQALTQENPQTRNAPTFDTSFQVSMGSTGGAPSASVGVEFGFGDKRKKKRLTTVSEVARKVSSPKKKKIVGPRTSDRESGVMGRLRAAGVNSLVGRNILGAYPGDALSPSEASSASGMVDLARKYGYGDWSDDDEEPMRNNRRRKPSSSSNKMGRRRKTASSSIGFDFDLSHQSSSTPPRSAARRKTPPRKTAKTLKDSFELSPILDRPKQSISEKNKDKMIRPAMERLREAQAKSEKKK
jgi:hypothetical protein